MHGMHIRILAPLCYYACCFFQTRSRMLFNATKLSCVRQDRILFTDVDIQLSAGDILQIAGRNGAGKSSLLRILAGLSEPSEGVLYYQAVELTKCHDDYAADLCFIGHLSGVQGQLTALENLQFWRACWQLNAADDWQLLATLGLAGLEDIPCQHLSAGQQRRVSLARLWLTPARIWILDEPFTALDQSAIGLLQAHFQQHCAKGGAIILTTHQPLPMLASQLRQLELEYRW